MSSATGAVKPQAPSQEEQAKTAAKQLEAFFLRQLLAEARPQGGGIDGGFAGDTFKQMLDEALADRMSNAGGFGMASMFQAQLDGSASQITQHAHGPMGEVLAPGLHGPRPFASIPDPTNLGPELNGAPRFAMPVSGRATSGYGERIDPIRRTHSMHNGFDFAAKTGTQVGAASGGEVTHAGPAGTYGNLVVVRHEDGFETRYAHLSEVHVKKGDRVETGADIGAVGSTGHSTGPHLHFEIRKEGKALDPRPYLPLHHPENRATR
ncbi:MAG: peptidoglycan DD-metalloendopeptidase family protein [Kofleriaceae bacterium]